MLNTGNVMLHLSQHGTYGQFLVPPAPHNIGPYSDGETFMQRELIRNGLLVTLAGRYDEDPTSNPFIRFDSI